MEHMIHNVMKICLEVLVSYSQFRKNKKEKETKIYCGSGLPKELGFLCEKNFCNYLKQILNKRIKFIFTHFPRLSFTKQQ